MAEYIKREALLDSLRESRKALQEICKGLKFPVEKQICDAQILTFQECILRAKEQPTADVVEVVRCKDCVYSRPLCYTEKKLYNDDCVGCTQISTSYHSVIMSENDYCSYGERRCEE